MTEGKTEKKNLFTEFEPTSTEEWEEVLTRDLKGGDYKKKLNWESIEGIEALPFYRKEDLDKLSHMQNDFEIKTPAGWQFCEIIESADPEDANREAKKAIEGGADSLWITLQLTADEGALGGDITGTNVQNSEDLKTLLNGIDLKKTVVVFDSGAGSPGVLGLVKGYLKSSGRIHSNISFLFDPFTFMAHRGRLPLPDAKLDSVTNQMASEPEFMTLAADGAFYHNCGATIVQELGIALAIGSEFLARVPESNRNQAANQFWMHLSAGSLYFPEIAKLRAARLLWNRVLDGYEIENREPLIIHSSTSKWNKSIADPHNNILRATTEATSAAVGGANRITVHPYNAHFEKTDPISQRIARNVSHILDEEVHLSMVENPADGSYYIELLTDEIARKAWEFFQLIEKQGGIQKAIEGKIIQGEIGRSRSAKDKALATRKLTLAGVNITADAGQKLPNDLFKSTPVDSLQKSGKVTEIAGDTLIDSIAGALAEGATLGDVVHSFLQPQKQLYPALNPYRAAVPFEELRLRTQDIAKERGKEITAQLVPIGSKKMRKARATFSQNYLECAGFRVESHTGFASVEDAASELGPDGSDIFVLCSSDGEYADLVTDFCSAFGEKATLILAGYPKDQVEQYKETGIDFFIYSGSNMLETLREIQGRV